MLPRPAVLTGALGLVLGLLVTLVGPLGAAQATTQGKRPVSDVFSGIITTITPVPGTKRTKHHRRVLPSSTYDVEVKTVYHGSIDTAKVTVHSLPAAQHCPSGKVRKGKLYLFGLHRRSGVLTRAVCPEMVLSTGTGVSRLDHEYGSGHPPIAQSEKPPLPQVVSTNRDVGSPTSFTRLAAPGLAVVIVALLGLVVIRRLNRLRRV